MAHSLKVHNREPAFAQMSVGLLELTPDGDILVATAQLSSFFGSLATPGKPFAAMLHEAEKGGLVVPSVAGVANRNLEHSRQQLIAMHDGRTVSQTAQMLVGGGWLLEFHDVSHVVAAALSQQRDVLTELANRVAFSRRMNDRLADPTIQTFGLLYVDLDRFKTVNDTLGHPIGDALLKLVAARMSKQLEPEDLIARLGGDEFAILLRGGRSPAEAEELAARVIDVVSRPYLIQGHSVQVGASVGIAFAPADGATPETLIRNADLALFKAKSHGRGMLKFYTEDMDREIQARRSMEIDLRRALVLEEFAVVYQPQFQIAGNHLVGFEALVRWSTPTRGNVSPAQFIPLAEEIGLIGKLGEWVLRTACKEAAQWTAPLSVSVNLSPRQFQDASLVGTVVSALSQAGLPASRLELEITEGALLDDTDAVIATLRQLKQLGVKIAMDDFGTGYSSLSYLQKFPFDKIKIDQSFVRSLGSNPESAAIVRAVTALGESLGMVTIAEGVETEHQLDQIARDGCQQVQGYLTGKPMPQDAAAALVLTLFPKPE